MALLGILVFVFFYSAIPALSAQLATKILFKFKPSFKDVFLLVSASLVASAFVNMAVNFLTSSNSEFKQDSIFIPTITFLLARFILFAKFIKQPEIGAIGQSKALKVVVLSTIIEILLALAIALIFMVLFNVMH